MKMLLLALLCALTYAQTGRRHLIEEIDTVNFCNFSPGDARVTQSGYEDCWVPQGMCFRDACTFDYDDGLMIYVNGMEYGARKSRFGSLCRSFKTWFITASSDSHSGIEAQLYNWPYNPVACNRGQEHLMFLNVCKGASSADIFLNDNQLTSEPAPKYDALGRFDQAELADSTVMGRMDYTVEIDNTDTATSSPYTIEIPPNDGTDRVWYIVLHGDAADDGGCQVTVDTASTMAIQTESLPTLAPSVVKYCYDISGQYWFYDNPDDMFGYDIWYERHLNYANCEGTFPGYGDFEMIGTELTLLSSQYTATFDPYTPKITFSDGRIANRDRSRCTYATAIPITSEEIVKGDVNTMECPAGSKNIKSRSTCEVAAFMNGLKWTGVLDWNSYENDKPNECWFNEQAQEAGFVQGSDFVISVDEAPLCRQNNGRCDTGVIQSSDGFTTHGDRLICCPAECNAKCNDGWVCDGSGRDANKCCYDNIITAGRECNSGVDDSCIVPEGPMWPPISPRTNDPTQEPTKEPTIMATQEPDAATQEPDTDTTSPEATESADTTAPEATDSLVDVCGGTSNPEAIVIDVRRPDEWAAGTLGCANLLTLDDTLTQDSVLNLSGGDMNVEIIVYCRSGGRAGQALAQIESWGYTDVTNAGGYDDLVAAGCSCGVAKSEIQVVLKVRNVNEDNWVEVEPALKKGVSAAYNVPERDIQLSLDPADARRLLSEERLVTTTIQTEDADALRQQIENTPENDVMSAISDSLTEGGVDYVSLTDISAPVVVTTSPTTSVTSSPTSSPTTSVTSSPTTFGSGDQATDVKESSDDSGISAVIIVAIVVGVLLLLGLIAYIVMQYKNQGTMQKEIQTHDEVYTSTTTTGEAKI